MAGAGGEIPRALQGVKLYIGIPTRGTCSVHFARSLAHSVGALTLVGVEVEIHQSVLSCFVDMSRNTLVSEFLKTDCTHLMMIDDDMGWDATSIFKMLLADMEFIAAAGPKKVDSGDQFCCHINVNADETPMVRNGLISASHVGGAFVLLKRAAIERMIEAYPDLICKAVDLKHGYRFFETRYSENTFHSEDYLFCDRFTEAGGEIWILPDVTLIHTGVKDYSGNYHKFLVGQPMAEAKRGANYSVVIVVYKGQEALNRCLKSVQKHSRAAQIIIIDNSPEAMQIGIPAIVKRPGNIGFAAGCNLGASLATGDNLVFLNPDTIVYDGWLEKMGAHLREGVGAVGPISNFVAGMQNWVCYAHSERLIEKEQDTGEGYTLTEPQDFETAAKAIYESKIHAGLPTKLLIGFCLMVPRTVWDAVGPMDPVFLLGCDDLDYSMRLTAAGYKMIIAPDVFVYHEGHVSFREEGDPALEMNRQSEEAMRKKLTSIYGDAIPTSTEIWGCEIFPTEAEHVLPA